MRPLQRGIARARHAMSDQSLYLMPEFQCRLNVLKQLKHIDDDETVLLKGRVACEVSSSESLIVTELMFQNVRNRRRRRPCLRMSLPSHGWRPLLHVAFCCLPSLLPVFGVRVAQHCRCVSQVLSDLTAAECVSLLSCLIFQEKVHRPSLPISPPRCHLPSPPPSAGASVARKSDGRCGGRSSTRSP